MYVFRKLLSMALVVLLAAASLQGVSAAAQGPAVSADLCSIPKHLTRIRPNPGGEPVGVKVGITLIDVIELNDVAESFKVDFMLNLQWQDARLSASERGGSLEDCILGLNDIWNPHFQLVNRRGRILEQEQDVDIAADGTVRFVERIFGELSSPLDLHDFPFDVQRLPMQFASFIYGPEDVIFVADDTRTPRLESISQSGWDVLSNSSKDNVPGFRDPIAGHTHFNHTIVLARKPGYYLWTVLLPLCLVVLMAWCVFWLDPQAYGTQIGLSTGAVFSLLAYLLGLRHLLPRVAYLTRADQVVLASMILVFLALGEAILTSRLAQQEQGELARKIDRRVRWIYLAVFGVLVLFTIGR
jgi:hypothetical protein